MCVCMCVRVFVCACVCLCVLYVNIYVCLALPIMLQTITALVSDVPGLAQAFYTPRVHPVFYVVCLN